MTITNTLPSLADLGGSYVIDVDHSRVGFVARHAMVTKVRGSFNRFDGRATIAGADLAASRVELSVDVASIDTRNADRDEHLRSNDFLAIDEHPSITFASTAVRLADATTVEITGDLTIRGVTRSVTIPFEYGGAATDPDGDLRIGFEGSTTINRRDFGVSWNAGLEAGGVLVGDKVVLEFEISAVRAG